MPIPTPQTGFVHLVLHDEFYLEIPILIVSRLCLKPLKYLSFLGWCVLGALGELVDHEGNRVELDAGTLPDQSVYEYKTPDPSNVPARVVQLDFIKSRSASVVSPSGLTPRRAGFRDEVMARDGQWCVWTGADKGNAMHILPHRLGDDV